MTLTIRPFDPTPEEYAAVVTILNAREPHRYPTVASLREFDQLIVPGTVYSRFVGELAGQVVAVSTYGQSPRLLGTDKYTLDFDLHPEHESDQWVQQLYEHLVDLVKQRNASTLLTDTNATNSARIRFLEQQGFTLVQRVNNSVVDLTAFDPVPFLAANQKLAEQQIAIYTLAQLQTGDADWLPKLADLFWAIRQDMPNSEPPVRESLEQFRQRFALASFRPEAWLIAIDETQGKLAAGTYVGLTNLWLEPDDPGKAWTGQTGVTRSHRRRGIATTLKVQAMTFAQAAGVRTIFTANDATNPMFDLNLALGFTPTLTRLKYRKMLIQKDQ